MTNPTLFYKKGTYAITINPTDKYQYYGKHDRLEKFKTFINEQLVHYPQYGIHYKLWIELSEPKNKTVNGPRLHLHGIITFHSKKSVKHFLLNEIYKITRYAVYDIDTIENMETWITYCTKQQHIIDEPPITNTTP